MQSLRKIWKQRLQLAELSLELIGGKEEENALGHRAFFGHKQYKMLPPEQKTVIVSEMTLKSCTVVPLKTVCSDEV